MPIEMGTKITFFPAISFFAAVSPAASARTPVASAKQAPIARPTIFPCSLLRIVCNIIPSLGHTALSQIADCVGLCVSRIEIVVDENSRHQHDTLEHVLDLRAEIVERHAVPKDRNQRRADQKIAYAAASASERDAAQHDDQNHFEQETA